MSMGNELYLTNCLFNANDINDIIESVCRLFECDLDYIGDNGDDFTWACALREGKTSEEWLIDSAKEFAKTGVGFGDVVDYILDTYFDCNSSYYWDYTWDLLCDADNYLIGIAVAYVGY